jgi:hypothetical protein
MYRTSESPAGPDAGFSYRKSKKLPVLSPACDSFSKKEEGIQNVIENRQKE